MIIFVTLLIEDLFAWRILMMIVWQVLRKSAGKNKGDKYLSVGNQPISLTKKALP